MGYDQHHQASSSATVVIVVAVLIVAVLGAAAVAGAGLFWVGASRMESQAIVAERLAVAEAEHSEAHAQMHVQSSVAVDAESDLDFEVVLDREGTTSVAGQITGLDELKAQLAKLKDETSNAFSVSIHADAECPIKFLVPVLEACNEIGDIDFNVLSSTGSDTNGFDAESQ